MGHLSRRLSIGSSKSRTKSLNPGTGLTDVEDAGLSHELPRDENICEDGEDTQVLDGGPLDGATVISSASAPQQRRPSLLARLRRRSSSVAPPPVEDNHALAAAGVPDDIVAAAAAAEVARELGNAGNLDTKTQRGRESRRSSFSVIAKARAALTRRSLSRASSRENRLNTDTGVASLARNPSGHSFLEAAPEGCSNNEIAKTNSPYVPVGVPLARDRTGDGDDEEGASFPHLPLEQDPLDVDPGQKEQTCVTPPATQPAPEDPAQSLQEKQESVVEQEELKSKDEMTLSETPDQLKVAAPTTQVSVADATVVQDGIQQQQGDDVLEKAGEEGTGTGLEKPKRKLGLTGRKKEGRSAGGSTKNESRKALRKGIENRETGRENKEDGSSHGTAEVTKPASRWRRRLSLSRERRHSTQSGPNNEEKKEDERESVFGCESVCTEDAGRPGYLGRIRRRISLSRDKRAGRDGSVIRKDEGTDEERTNTGPSLQRTETGPDAEEAEGVSGCIADEGKLLPKKASGWDRLRRSSITSAVAAVRGRSRDARGGAGALQHREENSEQEAQQQENSSLVDERHSFAKSLRRRLSRSSLRLPRSNSRESSLGSKCQEGNESLCGITDDGTESIAGGKETKNWRRRISDRFRSKSRDPPLPSPRGTTSALVGLGVGTGTEERRLYSEDKRNCEYADKTLEAPHAAEKPLGHAVEKQSPQEEAKLVSERQNSYNSSGERSSGEQQTRAKGNLSEELSEPFAVTPETSQTPSEQPSSAGVTPRYQESEYSSGQKLNKRAEKTAAQRQRDRSAFAEKRHGRGKEIYEGKEAENATRSDPSTIGSGPEDFMQWMSQSQDEEERQMYTALPDEKEARGYDVQSNELKEANEEGQRKKLSTFFCCGSDDSETTNEKDKWKSTLQKRLAKDEGSIEKYGYADDTIRRKVTHLPQPLLCKDLFDDAEIGYGYPLSYAPTDCLLELGLAI